MKTGDVFDPYNMFNGAFIPNGLLRLKSVSSSAKLVWARLSQYKGSNKCAFPSYKTLSEEVGISPRRCMELVEELIKHKLIKKTAREGHSNFYEFLWHECFEGDVRGAENRTPAESRTPAENRTGSSAESRTPGGAENRTLLDSFDIDSVEENQNIQPEGCPRCLKPCTIDSGVNYVIQQIHDRYKEKFGICPTILEGKDQAQIKRLLSKNISEAAIISNYTKYISAKDPWYQQQGYDISTFVNKYDAIRMRPSGGSNGRTKQNNRQAADDSYMRQVRALGLE